MLAKVLKYIREPYPYLYRNQKRLLLFLGVIVVLSFLFSYSFDPFEVNVDEHKMSYVWILCIHAALPLPIAFVYFNILNWTVKDDATWTLGKEMLYLCLLLIFIGIGSFLVRDIIYDNPNNWSWRYFGEEIRNSVLVGALLLTIVLPLNLERLIHKHNTSLKDFQLTAQDSHTTSELIQISSNSDQYAFEIHDFLFAKVESNYTEIYTKTSSGFQKDIVRITLKELESKFENFSFIYKTHRSYLVNLHQIEHCSGNVQGYKLTLKNYSKTVPVSRSKIKGFNEQFSR